MTRYRITEKYHQLLPNGIAWHYVAVVLGGITAVALVIWLAWYLFMHTPSSLTQGEVVNHRYTAPHNHVHDGGSTCWARDEDGNCTWRVENPDTNHEHCSRGCFDLLIDGCSDDRGGRTHCRLEWTAVPESQFVQCTTGRTWLTGEGCPPR